MFEEYKNIYTLLGSLEKKARWTFNYYEPSDMASYMFIGLIIERSDSILEYYEQHKRIVSDIDSYLDYIFIYVVQKYSNMESDIREEYRESFRRYFAEYSEIYTQYQEKFKYIVRYIIGSYEEILQFSDEKVIVF